MLKFNFTTMKTIAVDTNAGAANARDEFVDISGGRSD